MNVGDFALKHQCWEETATELRMLLHFRELAGNSVIQASWAAHDVFWETLQLQWAHVLKNKCVSLVYDKILTKTLVSNFLPICKMKYMVNIEILLVA